LLVEIFGSFGVLMYVFGLFAVVGAAHVVVLLGEKRIKERVYALIDGTHDEHIEVPEGMVMPVTSHVQSTNTGPTISGSTSGYIAARA
jgi:hypothetical protein